MHCASFQKSMVFVFCMLSYVQFVDCASFEAFVPRVKGNLRGLRKDVYYHDASASLPQNEEQLVISEEVLRSSDLVMINRVKRGTVRKTNGAVHEDRKRSMTPKEEKRANRVVKSRRRMISITVIYCVFSVFISIGVVAINLLKTIVYKCEKAAL